MHFNFPFSVNQVLWALTFAAQLVLLVVLLGRDRVRRFPWFTFSIALFALRLVTEELLSGRMAIPTLRIILITLADVAALVGVLVVVEMARRAFSGAERLTWMIGTLVVLVVAGGVLAVWGPWPGRRDFVLDSPMSVLKVMQFLAQKIYLLIDLLTVQLGLLVVLFGRHFKAGWRSQTQRIVIGLSTVSICSLAIQIVATTLHPHNPQEYERIIGIWLRVLNANKALYVAVLVWWIASLWFDEPGTTVAESEGGPYKTPEDEAAEGRFIATNDVTAGSDASGGLA